MWEGHKIWKNLPLVLTFTLSKSADLSKQEGDFFEFFWPFQKSWTLPIVIWQVFLTAILHRSLRIFFSFTLHLLFLISIWTFIYLPFIFGLLSSFYIPFLFGLLSSFYIWIFPLFHFFFSFLFNSVTFTFFSFLFFRTLRKLWVVELLPSFRPKRWFFEKLKTPKSHSNFKKLQPIFPKMKSFFNW